MEWVIKIIGVIAGVFPGLIAAWTGHESDSKAIEHLNELTDGLTVRTGREGAWDRELAARKDRIARSKRAEVDPQ